MKKRVNFNSFFFFIFVIRLKRIGVVSVKKTEEISPNRDCWIAILLLTTLIILIQTLKRVSISISLGILLLPGVYFLSNYILKKYDYKKAIAAIAISGVISLSFHVILAFFLERNNILTNSCGDFCGYVVSQFIHILSYEYLWNRDNRKPLLVYLTYIGSVIIYLLFFSLIYLYLVLNDGFWFNFFLLVLVEAIICIPVTYMDLLLKIEKNKKNKSTRFKFV